MEVLEIDFSKCCQIGKEGTITILQDPVSSRNFFYRQIDLSPDVNLSVWKADMDRRINLVGPYITQLFLYQLEGPASGEYINRKAVAHVIFESFNKDLE